MGKKVKKNTRVQNFQKRKEEKEKLSESPFSSIVLKEKSIDKETMKTREDKKKASEVVGGYDPNASFADILANYERTGNPYAMPKKGAQVKESKLSFQEILDKWEGKEQKKDDKKEGEVNQKKSEYKATKSFAEILSAFEGKDVESKKEDVKESVIDEEVEVKIEKKEEEISLFRKENDEEGEVRSSEASWSIYGNNESFVRVDVEIEEKEEEKPIENVKKSEYKATKDFGEILNGFYADKGDDAISKEEEKAEEEIKGEENSLFKAENKEEGEVRSSEASWSIYGISDKKAEKEEKKHNRPDIKKEKEEGKKKEYKGKKDFSKTYENYEKKEVKTFEEILKEKGDIPQKSELTINRLRTMMPQSTLDLHGKTQEEAEADVKEFLSSCRSHGIRKISIITGKGLHSEGGVGVLRDAVIRTLNSDGGITECSNAPLQFGGSGVLWVILKKNS